MTKLFVGGLDYSINNDALAGIFQPFGTVSSAEVVTDRFSGKSKGFGFVEMENDDEAQNAISQLDGTDYENRRLGVSVAKPKEEGSRPNRNNDRRFSNDRNSSGGFQSRNNGGGSYNRDRRPSGNGGFGGNRRPNNGGNFNRNRSSQNRFGSNNTSSGFGSQFGDSNNAYSDRRPSGNGGFGGNRRPNNGGNFNRNNGGRSKFNNNRRPSGNNFRRRDEGGY